MARTLSDLVTKTEGPQPWRRLFHAATGSTIVLVLGTQPIRDRTVFLVLGSLLGTLLLLDLLRLALPRVNHVFFSWFTLLASPREKGKIASSTWYLVGVLGALVLYPREAAVGGILVLALADPAASLLGRRFGVRRLGKGTLVGSGVFTLVAFGVLAARVPWPHALVVAAVVGSVEAIPWGVDDNLSVPLVAAGALSLLGL